MTATPHRLEPYAQLPDRYSDRQVAASTVDALGRVVTLLVPPEATCTRRVPPDQRLRYDALAMVMDGTDVHDAVEPAPAGDARTAWTQLVEDGAGHLLGARAPVPCAGGGDAAETRPGCCRAGAGEPDGAGDRLRSMPLAR
ncbi:hypothetical protein ACFRFL_42530 [Streptomyces sp. NPDC056708]|uniref:hypothetical protein n=1 Tax=unclassified Streptomyces TaxID=2593676 RepID=UPI003686344D